MSKASVSVKYPKMLLILSQNDTKNFFISSFYGGVYSLNENLTVVKT
jgi:hypothetical protein